MRNRTLTFILVGGVGSRLFPLTSRRSKPSVLFGGNYRIIDFTLANCLHSGLRSFDRAHFKAFGDYALLFDVVYWIQDPDYTVGLWSKVLNCLPRDAGPIKREREGDDLIDASVPSGADTRNF